MTFHTFPPKSAYKKIHWSTNFNSSQICFAKLNVHWSENWGILNIFWGGNHKVVGSKPIRVDRCAINQDSHVLDDRWLLKSCCTKINNPWSDMVWYGRSAIICASRTAPETLRFATSPSSTPTMIWTGTRSACSRCSSCPGPENNTSQTAARQVSQRWCIMGNVDDKVTVNPATYRSSISC